MVEDARDPYYQASYTTEQEAGADRLSVLYLALAGFDPMAAPRVWKRAHGRQGSSAARQGFLHGHPLNAERMAATRTAAAQVEQYVVPGRQNPKWETILAENALYRRAEEPAYEPGVGLGRALGAAADTWLKDLLQQVISQSDDAKALGVLGPSGDSPRLLALKKEVDWREWGPLAVSEAWILEEQVLKSVLGDLLQDRVTYIHDHVQAMEQVHSGESQMAFLVKPFPMDQFYEVVSQGQRLPRKSTFFYPKLPTGLVINQLDGSL